MLGRVPPYPLTDWIIRCSSSMRTNLIVYRGSAEIVEGGLRCGIRHLDAKCGKLLARLNRNGAVSGKFKCDRCKQVLEVPLEIDTDQGVALTLCVVSAQERPLGERQASK
jgi:phage FluMu protein Com